MKVYKFKDDVDGNYIFILAPNLLSAEEVVKNKTSLPYNCVDIKTVVELERPIVIFNNILPF
jgi:hypothetical protein